MTNDFKTAEAFLCRHFPEGGRILCAVSGGLDSMCLLHWMAEREGFFITAAHFNHQLRGELADRDETFVAEYCAAHKIPFVSGSGNTREVAVRDGLTTEEAARNLRYAFLKEAAEGYDAIFTAHHADDNAETMLLNLLRGTGSMGLAGIPPVRGKLYRPFLEVTHTSLLAYAAENNVPHTEDETNRMDDASRNVLRHQVMPVLKQLNPRAIENMTRAARLLREESDGVEMMAAELSAQARPTAKGLTIDIASLAAAETVVRRAILQMMAEVSGHRKDLTATHVEDVLGLQPGRQVSLPYGMVAYRTAGELLIEQSEATPEEVPIQLGETVRFGDWEVTVEPCESGNISLPEGATLCLTTWNRDDGLTLPGAQGRRSLKRLCVDRGIAPAERDTLPVLRVNGQIAAVPHVGIDISFAPENHFIPVQVKFDKSYKRGKIT